MGERRPSPTGHPGTLVAYQSASTARFCLTTVLPQRKVSETLSSSIFPRILKVLASNPIYPTIQPRIATEDWSWAGSWKEGKSQAPGNS